MWDSTAAEAPLSPERHFVSIPFNVCTLLINLGMLEKNSTFLPEFTSCGRGQEEHLVDAGKLLEAASRTAFLCVTSLWRRVFPSSEGPIVVLVLKDAPPSPGPDHASPGFVEWRIMKSAVRRVTRVVTLSLRKEAAVSFTVPSWICTGYGELRARAVVLFLQCAAAPYTRWAEAPSLGMAMNGPSPAVTFSSAFVSVLPLPPMQPELRKAPFPARVAGKGNGFA